MENINILLLESKPPKPLSDVINANLPDPRVYALAPSSIGLLKGNGSIDSKSNGHTGLYCIIAMMYVYIYIDIGVWDVCTASNRVVPYDHMQVWDSSGTGYVRFDATTTTSNNNSSNNADDSSTSEEFLGCIVEHGLLQSSLYDHLLQLKGIITHAY